MNIRKGTPEDIDRLMEIYQRARQFMQATGNGRQWVGGYPQREVIMGDIERGESYVCDDDDGRPVAAFCLAPSPEPTYAAIYGGAWLNDDPYHVIHRLASDGTTHGVGRAVIDWCKKRHQNLRIDTHADNRVMQSVAERCGFARCGIIYVANGSPRIAYQLKPRKG